MPTSTGSRWLRRFHPADADAPALVCLPHAGGSATAYLRLAKALAPAVAVLAVQYPGRQDRHREPCVAYIGSLADAVCATLLAETDRPLALFGHSMGAIVAFETALRLQGTGRAPLALFASGRAAPTRYRERLIHLLSDADLAAELTRLDGTGSAITAEADLLALVLPAIRNDFRAVETYRYRPGPPLHCPITALIGDDDPYVSAEEAIQWGLRTEGRFELRVFTGGHFYLDSHTTAVAATITATLGCMTGRTDPATPDAR